MKKSGICSMLHVPCFNVHSARRGFTILETIVALFIFSFSVTAMVVVIGGGAGNAAHAKARITAVYLAEEGIELIRSTRDAYFLAEPSASTRWAAFTDLLADNDCFEVVSNFGCVVWFDADTGPRFHSYNGTYSKLRYDSAAGLYGYGAGTTTGYSRYVTTDTIAPGVLRMTVHVNYTDRGKTNAYDISEIITNWF